MDTIDFSRALRTLMARVDPPAGRRGRVAVDTRELRLPAAYVELFGAYGPGRFSDGTDNSLVLFAPPGQQVGTDMVDFATRMTPVNRENMSGDSSEAAAIRRRWNYADWPGPGGLLPWADLTAEITLWWDTTGPPEQWTTVAENWEDMRMIRLPGSVTEILLGLMDGRFDDPVFSTRWSSPVRFTPAGE